MTILNVIIFIVNRTSLSEPVDIFQITLDSFYLLTVMNGKFSVSELGAKVKLIICLIGLSCEK